MAWQAQSWIKTLCHITKAEVQYEGERGAVLPSLNVLYNYTLGGAYYESNKYSLSWDKDWLRDTDEVSSAAVAAAELTKSGDTDCYYNPNAPGESVIRKEYPFPLAAIQLAIWSIILFVAWLVLAQKCLRYCKQRKSAISVRRS